VYLFKLRHLFQSRADPLVPTMGIKGLISFLKKKVPHAFVPLTQDALSGKTIGIDLSITLYRGASTAYKNGPFSHLETLLKEILWLSDLGCTPIYVVDGVAPEEKQEEAERREVQRKSVEARLLAARQAFDRNPDDENTKEVLEKLQRQCFKLTDEMREEAYDLLSAVGVALCKAPGEAERSLAHMQKAGRVDLIFTEDVDVIVCGAASYAKYSNYLRDCFQGGPGASRTPELVHLQMILDGLNVSYDAFVIMALLAGCDFAPKIPSFGPATAFKHVLKYGDKLGACFKAPNLRPYEHLLERYEAAFRLMHFDPSDRGPMMQKHDWNEKRLEEICTRLKEKGSVVVLKGYIDACRRKRETSDLCVGKEQKRARMDLEEVGGA
jgi:5'-3' exonuclease